MPTETPKKSLSGRLFRLFAVILVVVVVLVALAPTFLSGFIQGKVEGAMEEQLDADVQMDNFSFGWFSGAEIENFTMTRTGQSDPALSIGRLTTDPSLKEIMSGRYVVEDIVVEDVVFRVARTESGVDWQDISKSKTEKKEESAESVSIPDFLIQAEVKNLRVIYDDPQLSEPFDFAGLNVKFVAENGKDCTIAVTGPYGLNCNVSCQVFDGDMLRTTDAMTANGTLNIGNLNLGDFGDSLKQFLANLEGEFQTQQQINYGPGGVITVNGKSTWKGLVAKTEMAGLSAKSGSCVNNVSKNDDGQEVQAQIRVMGAEIVGLPKQIKGLPCGEGAIDIALSTDQMLSFTNGLFQIPGGNLNLDGSHGLGDKQGQGINLKANTDLALWSGYFDGLPTIQGKVVVDGSVPADVTTKAVVMKVAVDALRLTGGPLEDKAYDCGRTTIDLKLKMPKDPKGPMAINFDSNSRLWQVESVSSIANNETAAFGAIGNSSLKGSLDMERLMAPFTDSVGQGRVTFDFRANLTDKELGISDARVSGPQASALLSARIGEENDLWRFLFDGNRITYNQSDGSGLLVSNLQGRGTWTKSSKNVSGRMSLQDMRTVGGQGPAINSGQVMVEFTGQADQEAGNYSLNFDRVEMAGFKGNGAVDYGAETGLGKIRIAGEADYAMLSSKWLRLFDENAKGSGKGPVILELSPNGADWKAASGRLEMTVPSLEAYGFGVSDLVVKGDMANGIGKITEGTGKLNEGTVKVTGDIDLTGEETKFNASADMKRVRIVKAWQPAIARLIPLFAGIGVSAGGFISMDLKATGEGDRWETINPRLFGDGAFLLTEGRIDGAPILEALGLALGFNPNMDIKDINTDFQIKNGGIYQDGFVADLGSLQIKMAGTTFLDGRLDYDLGIKPVSNEPANWQRFVSLLSTDGFLAMKLTGTVDSPSPGLPDAGKLIEAGAKKLIGDGLSNLLGGKTKDGENKKKSGGLGGLLQGLGGGKKKDDNKKKDSNPLNGLLNGLGGGKKKDAKKKDAKKTGLGGLLEGLGGGNK